MPPSRPAVVPSSLLTRVWKCLCLVLFLLRFAYIEFCDKESVQTALVLDGSMFKDRALKVRRRSPLLCCRRVVLDDCRPASPMAQLNCRVAVGLFGRKRIPVVHVDLGAA